MLTQASHAMMEIFQFDDRQNARGLQVYISGSSNDGKWYAKNASQEDSDFYQKCFENADRMQRPVKIKVVKDTLTPQPVTNAQELIEASISSFANGAPHGALTGFFQKNGQLEPEKAGFLMISVEGPGIGKVSGHGGPQQCGKGMGVSSFQAMVNVMAPKIRYMGSDESIDLKIREKFQFEGEPLAYLYTTANLLHSPAIELIEGQGFRAAENDRASLQPLDFSNKEIQSNEILKEEIVKLYTSSDSKPLQMNVRYQLLDSQGKKRTFSYDGEHVTYHFEYEIK